MSVAGAILNWEANKKGRKKNTENSLEKCYGLNVGITSGPGNGNGKEKE